MDRRTAIVVVAFLTFATALAGWLCADPPAPCVNPDCYCAPCECRYLPFGCHCDAKHPVTDSLDGAPPPAAKPVRRLYLFTASWCLPCQETKPDWNKVARDYPGRFEEVDYDENKDLALNFGVRQIPTVVAVEETEVQRGGAWSIEHKRTYPAGRLTERQIRAIAEEWLK